MDYTLQEAIKGQVEYTQSMINPLHAKTFNGVCQIWIDTLQTAPTEMRRLELEIGRKKRRLQEATEAALKWKIDTAVEVLEWLKGRMMNKDFEVWAKSPKRP